VLVVFGRRSSRAFVCRATVVCRATKQESIPIITEYPYETSLRDAHKIDSIGNARVDAADVADARNASNARNADVDFAR